MYEQHLPDFVRNPDPSIYLGNSYLVTDVETTNTEKGSALNRSNRLLLACWSYGESDSPGEKSGSKWGSEFEQREWLEAIEASQFIIGHNAKFELGWAKRCGLDLRQCLVWHTMIAEKVLAGNRKIPLSLEATATRRGLGTKDNFISNCIKAG